MNLLWKGAWKTCEESVRYLSSNSPYSVADILLLLVPCFLLFLRFSNNLSPNQCIDKIRIHCQLNYDECFRLDQSWQSCRFFGQWKVKPKWNAIYIKRVFPLFLPVTCLRFEIWLVWMKSVSPLFLLVTCFRFLLRLDRRGNLLCDIVWALLYNSSDDLQH